MSAFTKGPWIQYVSLNGATVGGPCSVTIARCDATTSYAETSCSISVDEARANAQLIATAPDLLEALIMVRDADDDRAWDGLATMPTPARVKIDAAIAKAIMP